jgi:hypothetical protein
MLDLYTHGIYSLYILNWNPLQVTTRFATSCRVVLKLNHRVENNLVFYRDSRDDLPDVRDGLTRRERIVLFCLNELQQARGGRDVPTGMLYGSVVEYIDMSVDELQGILVRLIGDKRGR